MSVNLEITDASREAIATVKQYGGSISVNYMTELLLRKHL
jgi:hypothetical protein